MKIKEIVQLLQDKKIDLSQAKALLQQGTEKKQQTNNVPALDKVERYVTEVMASVLKFPMEKLHPKMQMEDYGIDSILAIKITTELEKDLGELSKTLFFEYPSIREISRYFYENYQNELSTLLSEVQQKAEPKSIPESQSDVREKDIAIIGLSGKYPFSPNVEALWENLLAGKDLISEIPQSRWDYRPFFDPRRRVPGKMYSKWGGFIKGIDEFDGQLFKLPPSDAKFFDPQLRLFLQTVWETFEDAGYTKSLIKEKYDSNVGVYVGVMTNDYPLITANTSTHLHGDGMTAELANRVSYFYDFDGPSISLNTMCSSSLAAIYLGCQSIWAKETRMALAGGVNLLVHPQKYLGLCDANLLSTDGRCRAFGKGGNGYVPSEGSGAVLLKPLSEAIADGDHIHGVIKGIALNNTGRSNSYRAPTSEAQAKVIEKALERAQVDPRAVSYIETHGTGTKLGDTIEIEGLQKAFSKSTEEKQFCPIGSIKSNLGHCESASGMVGLSKVLMQMKYKTLVPSIHTEVLNENIKFEKTSFYVQKSVSPWEKPVNEKGEMLPRLCGISSFGAGGVNVHMIVEEYEAKVREEIDSPSLVILSSASKPQLEELARRLLYVCDLQENRPLLSDVAYTLQTGREAMNHRLALICNDFEDLKDQLKAFLAGSTQSSIYNEVKNRNEFETPFVPSSPSDLEKVAKEWLDGYRIRWEVLWEGFSPCRVSLPTYPFKQHKMWVVDPSVKIAEVPEETPADFSQTIFSTPVWASSDGKKHALKPGHQKIAIYTDEKIGDALDSAIQKHRIVFSEDPEKIEENFLKIFSYIQEGLQSKTLGQASISLIVQEKDYPKCALFAGFFKSLGEENPKHVGRVVILPDLSTPSLLRIEQEWDNQEPLLKFAPDGTRYVHQMKEIENPEQFSSKEKLVKKGGVYWITGGAGGLGKLFAKYYGAKNVPATLILSGRSELNAQKAAEIDSLKTPTLNIEYVRCDVSEKSAVEEAVSQITKQFGKLDGIIHSAGVLRDGLFIKKSEKEVIDVFRPKICGTVYLDEATKEMPLDYFLLFSSESSLFGNMGQTDYASANAFLDAYPKQRKNRSGICKSINWPLWEQGGMQPPDNVIEMIKKMTGLIPLTTSVGTQALELMLSMPHDQIFICEGDIPKIKETFGITKKHSEEKVASKPAMTVKKQGVLVEDIKEIIAKLLEWDVAMIDVSASFQDLGMDSVKLTDFSNRLNEKFGVELAPTIFFEYAILEDFIAHMEELSPQVDTEPIKVVKGSLEGDVKEIIAKLLEWDVAMIDVSASFQDLGMDSVKLTDFSNRLNEKFEVELAPTIFFEYAILEDFIDYLQSLETAPPEEKPIAEPLYRIEESSEEPIAVIGMAGKFPKSETLDAFWNHLVQNDDLISEIPSQRTELKLLREKDDPGLHYGGYLDRADQFDAEFFGFSPREVELMDPQQRFTLQTVWQVIEDAGYPAHELAKTKMALFIGVSSNDYAGHIIKSNETSPYVSTGISHSILANRISYLLDFNGPSEPVNTACSSSLVALHRAIDAIRSKMATMAIVGGVNLILDEALTLGFRDSGMLSDDGRCMSFDKRANGYVRGEGVGALFLKPLSQAQADGDHIYALVKGSAINHGGRASSLTAPNTNAQTELLQTAYRNANVPIETVGYLETHGTGTSLGDPIEFEALKKVFGGSASRCALGAVKTNVGHLESAAGIAGLIKAILALQNKKIPGNLHLEELNPYIKTESTPFYFPKTTEEWTPIYDEENRQYPRRAGVSSFGYGGVNAHVVLEEYISQKEEKVDSALPLFLLSAKTGESLREYCEKFARLLDEKKWNKKEFDRLLYTLQAGREPMTHRLAILSNNPQDLREKLSKFIQLGKDDQDIFSQVLERKGASGPRFIGTDPNEIAQKWLSGISIDWKAHYANVSIKRMSLPTYPFAKERYWVAEQNAFEVSSSPLLELSSVSSENAGETTYCIDLTGDEFFLRDHVIAKAKVLPGVAYLECIHQAVEKIKGAAPFCIEELTWHMPVLAPRKRVSFFITLTESKQGMDVEIWNRAVKQRTLHCKAKISFEEKSRPASIDFRQKLKKFDRHLSKKEIYEAFTKVGTFYGPTFQTVEEIHAGKKEIISKISHPKGAEGEFILHPSLMDGALQSLIGFDSSGDDDSIPFGFDRFVRFASFPDQIYAHLITKEGKESEDVFDISILDEKGEVVAQYENFRLKGITPKDPQKQPIDERVELIPYLREVISKETKIPLAKLGENVEFEHYGIDSFMAINLTTALEERFGKLSKTMFYECQTIGELADYLIREKEETQIERESTLAATDIAIIGVSGHYPKSDTLSEFWNNLVEGKDCVSEIPEDRWDHSLYFDSSGEIEGKTYGKWGGFINDVDKFDPQFFNITHGEAQFMDPQERLFLQTTWEALEDSGYNPKTFSLKNDRKVGVFVGASYNEYPLYGAEQTLSGNPQIASANLANIANRVSYFFNFQGPSFSLDTLCSSSLTAIHLAVESLKRGEIRAAVVGGINITIHPNKFVILSKGRFLSSDGRCRTLGEGGDGFVPAEGVGSMILKPLDEAVANGDQIYGVIKATAINHGGKVKGYSVPSPLAQADVIRSALDHSSISADEINYIELHGTGTAIGDPIEISGLSKAFRTQTKKKQFCTVGSVKSNMGHAEAAAGIAGLTKILLQMKHKTLVPSIHAEEINQYVELEETPFILQRELSPWKPENENGLLTAGLSSFGAGGANAHVILQEYRDTRKLPEPISGPHLIFLSAKNKKALKAVAQNLLHFLLANAPKKGLKKVQAAMGEVLSLAPKMIDPDQSLVDFGAERNQLIQIEEKLQLKTGSLKGSETPRSIASVEESSDADLSIENLAYTLQVGREVMKTRLALMVEDFEDLLSQLEKFLSGKKLQQKNLADEVDFEQLNPPKGCKRIALPTYPFNKERIWIDTVSKENHIVQKKENGLDFLKEVINQIAAIPVDQLKAETTFEEIGLESVMIKKMAQMLSEEMGEIPTTAFFKYKTLKEFGSFLDGEEKERKVALKVASKEIAVIGITGRYPQAKNLEKFWENLLQGKDCIEEIPSERWDYRPFFSEEKGAFGKLYCKWGGFIDNPENFDPQFFNIAPDDARFMDPQERLFLEEAWNCFESAGYSKKEISQVDDSRRIGVFAGASFNNYQLLAADTFGAGSGYPASSQTFSIANRVSYYFDLHGPSLTVDTACSSSLYAIHMACESIRSGESTMAIAGGVNLSLHPSKYISLSMSQFAASDGRCHSFCEGGDGYVPGEGIGMVLLKPLEKALEDGDHIYGVIKGTGVSHDGHTQGYTVPNPVSQSQVIEAALANAQVSPESIQYVEAHGTGTALGDPIEIEGLNDVYKKFSEKKQYCAIGSVKSNIGHLEAAAGIAQMTKVLLQFKHEKIVPTLMHGDKLNEQIKFEKTPFYVSQKEEEWKHSESKPRRAAISSFGAGGVNVHLILEEAPALKPSAESKESHVIVLSAKTAEQLKEMRENLAHFLEKEEAISLSDIAYTLAVGREAMPISFACTVSTKEKLIQVLRDEQFISSDEPQPISLKGDRRRVALPTYPFSRSKYSVTQWAPPAQEEKSAIDHLSTLSALSEVERIDYLQEYLQKQVARTLGFADPDEVDLQQGFFEMGMESIQGVKLQKETESDFRVAIPDTAAFDYPNIHLFADYLLSLIPIEKGEESEEELIEALNQELASLNV